MTVEVQAVEQLTDELLAASRRLLPQLSSSVEPPDADGLARVAGHPANTLLVARDQGGVVGLLILVTVPLLTGVRSRIEDVVVDQAARRQGVGTALVTAAIRLAHHHGADTVDLTSRASRVAANRLYQRLGFQPHDTNAYRYQLRPPASSAAPGTG